MARTGSKDEVSFEDVWGDAAQMTLPEVGLLFRINVQDRFYLGPFRRAVEAQGGSFTKQAIDSFCDQALGSYYERYKGRKTPMDAARREFVKTAVPAPGHGEHSNGLRASLVGKAREDTLARVLQARDRASREGKALVFREALLEAVQAALRSGTGQGGPPVEEAEDAGSGSEGAEGEA